MVQIEVSGPTHAKKGYVMVAIARALRELGAEVQVLGETTHLAEKSTKDSHELALNLRGQEVRLTELQTGG
jgi:hypothetical protein